MSKIAVKKQRVRHLALVIKWAFALLVTGFVVVFLLIPVEIRISIDPLGQRIQVETFVATIRVKSLRKHSDLRQFFPDMIKYTNNDIWHRTSSRHQMGVYPGFLKEVETGSPYAKLSYRISDKLFRLAMDNHESVVLDSWPLVVQSCRLFSENYDESCSILMRLDRILDRHCNHP